MKKQDRQNKITCCGNETVPYHRDYKICGTYVGLAITQADGTCNNGVPYIPEENVIQAKEFVEENHK